jgi:hypothetical protein
MGGAYSFLVRRPEGKRPIGRPKRRRMDKIKMDSKEVRQGGIEWIDMAQDRDRGHTLISMVMNLLGSIKRGEYID